MKLITLQFQLPTDRSGDILRHTFKSAIIKAAADAMELEPVNLKCYVHTGGVFSEMGLEEPNLDELHIINPKQYPNITRELAKHKAKTTVNDCQICNGVGSYKGGDLGRFDCLTCNGSGKV